MEPVDVVSVPVDRVVRSMNTASVKILTDAVIGKPRIQMVPDFLRSIEAGERLFTPDIVAIGPYHRGKKQLEKMEDVKKAAALEFCGSTRYGIKDFYLKVQAVTYEARKCYEDQFPDISDGDFTDMMFYDGCFLLQFMAISLQDRGSSCFWKLPLLSENWMRRIQRDILLVENQLPWLVLEVLMSLKRVLVDRFIASVNSVFDVRWTKPALFDGCDEYRPFHLLDLVRQRQLGPVPKENLDEIPRPPTNLCSAIELAEVGIHLSASKTARFGDISVVSGLLFGELSLPPVVLGELTMCWLTNMAAFEMLQGGTFNYGVSSYVQVLAVLMTRAEDVHELRLKRVLYPVLSDQQTLQFFKAICHYLPYGANYFHILQSLNDYHQKRKVRVLLHKLIYNNFKYLLTAGPIIGFLISILKAITSLKQTKGTPAS